MGNGIKETLKALYRKVGGFYSKLYFQNAFDPKPYSIVVNPFFTARRLLFKEIQFCAKKMKGGKVLDIGCGSKPYRDLFDVEYYWGLDITKFDGHMNPHCDISYDGQNLPFCNESLDFIIMNEVLEHVFEPQYLLAEIYRILKPQGMLLITVPFVWDEHEPPYDFGRYTSFGLKYLLKKNDFIIEYYKKNGRYLNTLTQMMSSYIYTVAHSWRFPLQALVYIFLCAPIMLFGEILTKIAPENNNLYLDNVVLARKNTV